MPWPRIGRIFLTSYRPIIINEFGRRNAVAYNIPQYIDGSCRREPDFQNPYPSITACCRAGLLAPHLRPRYLVFYFAVRNNWNDAQVPHYLFTAVQKVLWTGPSHNSAEEWYKHRKLPVPSNCLIASNPPIDFFHTSGNFESTEAMHRFMARAVNEQQRAAQVYSNNWDREYRRRIEVNPEFVITKSLHPHLLNNPVPFFDHDVQQIFGRQINLQAKKELSIDQANSILAHAGLPPL